MISTITAGENGSQKTPKVPFWQLTLEVHAAARAVEETLVHFEGNVTGGVRYDFGTVGLDIFEILWLCVCNVLVIQNKGHIT